MQLFENDWSSLPLEYWLCAILLIVATVVALRQRHLLWVPPFLAVIGTIAAWYMVEPLYYDDFFLSFSPTDVAAGYRCLLVFVVTFVISGVLLMSASSVLRGIVATKGNDIGLLMRAFDRMSVVMTLLMAAFTIATVAWLGLYVFYTRGG